jgi:hypothetical protein
MRWTHTKKIVVETASFCTGVATLAWGIWYVFDIPRKADATSQRVEVLERAYPQFVEKVERKIDLTSKQLFEEFNKVNSRLGSMEGELKRIK